MKTSSLVCLPPNIKAVKSIPNSSLKYYNRDVTKKLNSYVLGTALQLIIIALTRRLSQEINAIAPARVDIKSYVFWDCIITGSPKTEVYLR